MSKKYSIFITVLFCLFLFGFGIALLVLPDREFSEQENRYLTQFKAPTLDSVFGENGQFMADFEKYVNDQFPLRDQWIQLKAWSERLLGKQENNKVYFGTDGQTLFAQFNALSDEALAERVDYVNQLRLGGLGKREALIASGKTRLRPILMTALTTILSMSTMIFSRDITASMSRGMAVVVAGGLAYATLMTLFIVPVMYDILYRRTPKQVDVGDDLDDVPDDAAEYLQSHRQEGSIPEQP